MLVRRELTGLLVALGCCNCAGPPAPAPKTPAAAPQPLAVAEPLPPVPSTAPAASDLACLNPTPPRTRPPSDVEAFERIARDPTAIRDDRARAAFQAARLHFEARDWAKAAELFRLVALEGTSDGELHGSAIVLYLEALGMLAKHRRTCDPVLRDDVQSMIARHCTQASANVSEACVMLRRIRFGLRRAEAVRAVELADASSAPDDWSKGAAAFRALFEDECIGTRSKPNWQCEEVGYNAGHLLALAGDRAGASRVLTQLRDPNNQIGDHGLVRRLESELAGKPREGEKASTTGSR
jgi:hypothetical protein